MGGEVAATVLPIVIEQGATFFLEFVWRGASAEDPNVPGDPVNLTGSSLRMQIRTRQQQPVKAQATSDDYISHDGAGGKITVKLPASVTSAIDVKSAKYDLEAEIPGDGDEPDVFRVLEGNVKVKPNITQIESDPVIGS